MTTPLTLTGVWTNAEALKSRPSDLQVTVHGIYVWQDEALLDIEHDGKGVYIKQDDYTFRLSAKSRRALFAALKGESA